MRRTLTLSLAAAALAAGPFGSVHAGEAPLTLVACAPGFPGNTEQAQPTMDDFAKAVTHAAGWPAGRLAAVYHDELAPGLERLRADDAALALIPLPLFLRYREELGLRPLLEVEDEDSVEQRWSLVARRAAVAAPAALSGWSIAGMPGYAPEFVRRVALDGYGPLPADVEIDFTGRVLGALRKAARGSRTAVLLDSVQTSSMSALPFAGELDVLFRSPAMPGSLLCSVGDRIDDGQAAALRSALLSLGESAAGADVLAELRLRRFRPVDTERLGEIESRYDGGGGS